MDLSKVVSKGVKGLVASLAGLALTMLASHSDKVEGWIMAAVAAAVTGVLHSIENFLKHMRDES